MSLTSIVKEFLYNTLDWLTNAWLEFVSKVTIFGTQYCVLHFYIQTDYQGVMNALAVVLVYGFCPCFPGCSMQSSV